MAVKAARTVLFIGDENPRFVMPLPGMNVPRCAVCKRPVDRFERYDEVGGEILFIAYCHGEQEEVRLSRAVLVEATAISSLEAFGTRRRANS